VTDDVWREFFDSSAPQYMDEIFTTDSVREAGFLVDLSGGGTAGNWGRRPVELDEMEIMAVLRRPQG
jgi:hypothetical protein